MISGITSACLHIVSIKKIFHPQSQRSLSCVFNALNYQYKCVSFFAALSSYLELLDCACEVKTCGRVVLINMSDCNYCDHYASVIADLQKKNATLQSEIEKLKGVDSCAEQAEIKALKEKIHRLEPGFIKVSAESNRLSKTMASIVAESGIETNVDKTGPIYRC